ncbi:MAG TPA: nitrite reductase (NAD(P)H) small subunit [Methylocella sp.]|nr:nitrite reductase (NAD(P)H) small subunit [Methylocella sp.]
MAYSWKKIGPVESIPVQGARRLGFLIEGQPVAIFRTVEQGLFALIDVCPHRQGPLSEGIICGATVTCPLHNWVIRLDNGTAVGPDEGQTTSLPVRIVAGEIQIGVPHTSEEAAA